MTMKTPAAVRLRLGALPVFLLALNTYLLTAAPTVTFVDSGELIVAARFWGVAHPPGFPLYILLAHLATLVPLGNIAQRVNFASAVFAALAATFLYLLVIQIMTCAGDRSGDSAQGQSRTSKKWQTKSGQPGTKAEVVRSTSGTNDLLLTAIPALVAALLLAFSRTFWSFATIAEVYTLNTWLILLVFYFLFRWRTKGANLDLYLAALLFGGALGVHHVTVALTLPAMAVLVYRTAGWQFFKSKRLLYSALIAVGALVLVYAYLPLAASHHPVLNWGDPGTMQKLWWHVSGRQYQVFLSMAPSQIAHQFVEFLQLAAQEFNPVWLPVGLVFVALGLIELFRSERTTFWFVALLILADLAYSLNYEIAEDKGAYYLPAFLAASLTAAFGVRFIQRVGKKQAAHWRPATAIATVLVLLLPAVTFARNFPYCNRHGFRLASDYVANMQNSVAPLGMLLTADWQVYSPFLYVREVTQQRRDIVVIDLQLLRRSWYYDYLRTQYPDLIKDNQNAVDAFLVELHHWEQEPQAFINSAALSRRISDRFLEMVLAFVGSHLRQAPVYVTSEVGTGAIPEDAELTQALTQKYQLAPRGLLFELRTDRGFQPDDTQLITRGLADGTFRFAPDDVVSLKVLSAYVTMLTNRGRYLEAYGRADEAMQFYDRALRLKPDSTLAQQALNELRRKRSGN
jgi:hypothetical protein